MRISDWSSDVCSSDLSITVPLSSAQDDLADLLRFTSLVEQGANPHLVFAGDGVNVFAVFPYHGMEGIRLRIRRTRPDRSEERRVGQECVSTCRFRWSPDH